METADTIEQVRLLRSKRYAVAKNFYDNGHDAGPGWAMLSSFPEWCCWPAAQRDTLLKVCGALLIQPVIRQWIDGRRIQQVRNILGERLFTEVINNTSPPKRMGIDVKYENIYETLDSAGAAVLLNAADESIKQWLCQLLPETPGDLPAIVAQRISQAAYSILLVSKEERLYKKNADNSPQPNSRHDQANKAVNELQETM